LASCGLAGSPTRLAQGNPPQHSARIPRLTALSILPTNLAKHDIPDAFLLADPAICDKTLILAYDFNLRRF
jgi:hypothetical protein